VQDLPTKSGHSFVVRLSYKEEVTHVEEYDPLTPYISAMNSPRDDYFVYAKGIDIWDYSGREDHFTQNSMVYFSENIYCFEDMFNTINYIWSN